MKKIFLFGTVTIILFASCYNSPKDKANFLIKEEMKKMLYHAETYDPVETKVDSAFAPFDDPAFYEKTLQLYNLNMTIDEYDRKMKDAKFSMSLLHDSSPSSYNKDSYKEAKDKYEKNAEIKRKAEDKAKEIANDLKTMFDKRQQFIGFKAWHRYRANNNAGQTVFGDMHFLFNKDLDKVIMVYDMSSNEYKVVQFLYKQMLGDEFPINNEALEWYRLPYE